MFEKNQSTNVPINDFKVQYVLFGVIFDFDIG